MAPKVKITKEKILNTAIELIRVNGEQALNARTLAKELNCSTQPIFSNYASMEELRRDVVEKANEIYRSYQSKEIAACEYPLYKASGMAYIKFAQAEKQLFKILFMRDRTEENLENDLADIDFILDIIQESLKISREKAIEFHVQMWIWVHGVATMIVTEYLSWDMDTISRMSTEVYMGLKTRYEGNK